MMGNFCGAGLVFLVCQKKKKKIKEKEKKLPGLLFNKSSASCFFRDLRGPLSSRQQTVKHTQHKHKLSYFCMRIFSKDLV